MRRKELKMNYNDVCILIPTLNEEGGIGGIINNFKKQGFKNILVMNGHSTDKTHERVRKEGVRLVVQTGEGKGTAIRQAFEMINTKIVLMIDGDGTYNPGEAERLLQPIIAEKAEHVIGNRFACGGKFTLRHRFGNWLFNTIFKIIYAEDVPDILSGYRAITKDAFSKLDLKKNGFEIETEMTIESTKKGVKMLVVQITYCGRKGVPKLSSFGDGFKIFCTLLEGRIKK